MFIRFQRGPNGVPRGHSGDRGYRSHADSHHHSRQHGGGGSSHHPNYRNAPPPYTRNQQHYGPKRELNSYSK